MSIDLRLGDCLDVMAGMDAGSVSAIVTDPPYGIDWNTDYTRFSGGKKISNKFAPIDGDGQPFDPAPWLGFPEVILFGANCYCDRLPPGSFLVWCKKQSVNLGKFLGDCEIAWKKGGRGVYLYHHIWNGFDRESERGETLHPTQKPVALMRWCIERLNLPPDSTILDPYMGSGSTGVAALRCGMNFIGIEKHEPYFHIAERRIAREREQAKLFV